MLNRIVKDRVQEKITSADPSLDFGAATTNETSLQMVIAQFAALGYLAIATTQDKAGKEVRTAVLTPLVVRS